MEAIERVERNDCSPARFQLESLMGCSLFKFLYGSFWKVLLKTSYSLLKIFMFYCLLMSSMSKTYEINNSSNLKLKKCIYLKLTINGQNIIRNSNETLTSKKESVCEGNSYQQNKLYYKSIKNSKLISLVVW